MCSLLPREVVEQPLKLHTCLGRIRKPFESASNLLEPAGEQDCANVALLLALCPLMLAFWIASSRVRENDHHPADVVFGAFIGSGWATHPKWMADPCTYHETPSVLQATSACLHSAHVVFHDVIAIRVPGQALFWYARYFRPAWKSAELSMVSSTDTAEQMMEP